MNVLTNLIVDNIRSRVKTVDGKTLTRPILNYGDGTNTTYSVDVDIGENKVLRSVPLATGNNSLIYAEVGSAVKLTKSDSGRLEVTAFSKRLPGIYERVPVTLPEFNFGIPSATIGVPEDCTYTARPLTFGELATLGPGFGTTPWGATAVFKGGVLQGIQ